MSEVYRDQIPRGFEWYWTWWFWRNTWWEWQRWGKLLWSWRWNRNGWFCLGRRFGRDLQIWELLCGHDIYKEEWFSFSQSLVISMAKRLLDKASIEKNPGSKVDDPDSVKDRRPYLDMEANLSSDANVTVQSRASERSGANNSGIRQRRHWLFNAKNWLELITCGTVWS